MKVIKDEDYENLAIHSSIFNEEGKLHKMPQSWSDNLKNKICVRIIVLAHEIDKTSWDEQVKQNFLKQLDLIYYNAKRMHHALITRSKDREKNDLL